MTDVEELLVGNKRFVDDSPATWSRTDYREKLLQQQQPFAVVVMCSDSRVAPEIIFDQPLGKLFVCRNAGAVVDGRLFKSIQYAIDILGVKLVAIVGHEKCGAVTMAAERRMPQTLTRGMIQNVLSDLEGADADVTFAAENAALVDNIVKCHAQRTAARVKQTLAAGRKEVEVVPFYYSMSTGITTRLNPFKTTSQETTTPTASATGNRFRKFFGWDGSSEGCGCGSTR